MGHAVSRAGPHSVGSQLMAPRPRELRAPVEPAAQVHRLHVRTRWHEASPAG